MVVTITVNIVLHCFITIIVILYTLHYVCTSSLPRQLGMRSVEVKPKGERDAGRVTGGGVGADQRTRGQGTV